MKKSKADKMYSNPPEAETDEKGNTTVKPGKADQEQSGTEGVAQKTGQAEPAEKMREMHHRHETEHMAMNRRHEVEMDAGGESSIEKHITEHKEMNQRHMAEMKKMHGGSKGDGEPVTKKGEPEKQEPEKKAKPEKGGEKE